MRSFLRNYIHSRDCILLCILMICFEAQIEDHQRARAAAFIYLLRESWTAVRSMLYMN